MNILFDGNAQLKVAVLPARGRRALQLAALEVHALRPLLRLLCRLRWWRIVLQNSSCTSALLI